MNRFMPIIVFVATAACGDNDEFLTRARAQAEVVRLDRGTSADSVFSLLRGQSPTFDAGQTSSSGRVRIVEWNSLQVTFLNDRLVSAKVLDLTK
jgi:hypothetical protein